MDVAVGSIVDVESLWEFLKSSDLGLLVTSLSVSTSPGHGYPEIAMELIATKRGDVDGLFHRDKWVDVNDRTPEDDREVLVCRGGTVKVAVFWGPEYGWSISPPPTCWMPMPQARTK